MLLENKHSRLDTPNQLLVPSQAACEGLPTPSGARSPRAAPRPDLRLFSRTFAAGTLFAAAILFSHQTMIGPATAIVSYVPKMMPINKASENGLSVSPPRITSATTERNTRPDVITVRESVWLIDRFVTS